MTTDWPVLVVQIFVGLATLALAVVSVIASASRIWVSMIVVEGAAGELEHGVLLIRNNSDRPVRSMKVTSRAWSSEKKIWFRKETCKVPIVFPGDTVVRSRSSTTDWDIPEAFFPHFSDSYRNAVGPAGDPYYVTAVTFEDAAGHTWKLENGHRLLPGEE